MCRRCEYPCALYARLTDAASLYVAKWQMKFPCVRSRACDDIVSTYMQCVLIRTMGFLLFWSYIVHSLFFYSFFLFVDAVFLK